MHLLEEELSIHSEEMVDDINNEELDVVLDSGHESPNIDEEVCNTCTCIYNIQCVLHVHVHVCTCTYTHVCTCRVFFSFLPKAGQNEMV